MIQYLTTPLLSDSPRACPPQWTSVRGVSSVGTFKQTQDGQVAAGQVVRVCSVDSRRRMIRNRRGEKRREDAVDKL